MKVFLLIFQILGGLILLIVSSRPSINNIQEICAGGFNSFILGKVSVNLSLFSLSLFILINGLRALFRFMCKGKGSQDVIDEF
ncbi:MAG: hypothetical protein MK105_05610 [Crocinitomicaceae bacterium]|nr:hypothetical protein [Crocinitomicaceae bacterium]